MRARKLVVALGLVFCWALPAYGAFGEMAATAGAFSAITIQPPTGFTATHTCTATNVADFTLDWAPSTTTFAEGYVLTRYRDGALEGTWNIAPASTVTYAQNGLSVAPAGTDITWELSTVAGTWTSEPATFTFTVSSPPQCGSAVLSVQYRISNTNATGDGVIGPDFRIANAGFESVPLSELSLRYWYTHDHPPPTPTFSCLSAQIGCGNVNGSVVTTTGDGRYLQLTFDAGSGSISNTHSGDIRVEVRRNQNFDETNDWSWDPTKTAFAEWNRVTLYRNGVLVWGVEP